MSSRIGNGELFRRFTPFDRFWYVLNGSFWFGLAETAKTSLLDRGVIDMSEECVRAFVTTSDPDDPDDPNALDAPDYPDAPDDSED